MFNSWLALTLHATQLGLEAQSVVVLRLNRLARGGGPGLTEAGLMITDKMAALAEAQFAAATAVMTGNTHSGARTVLHVFRKRVRANRKRLSRRDAA
jgi:hypothetical protein